MPPSAIWARTSTIVVLENLYDELKEKVDFFFDTPVQKIRTIVDGGY